MKREKCLFRVHFQAAVIRTCSLRRLKKKNLRLQPIKRRARFYSLEAKLVALSLCFEALAHKFDARSCARPTLSQNSDLEEDFQFVKEQFSNIKAKYLRPENCEYFESP